MKNVYQDSDMKYSEIITAIEDYTYGDTIRASVNALTPFISPTLKKKAKNSLYNLKICNKYTKSLGLGWWRSLGYIYIEIPFNL